MARCCARRIREAFSSLVAQMVGRNGSGAAKWSFVMRRAGHRGHRTVKEVFHTVLVRVSKAGDLWLAHALPPRAHHLIGVELHPAAVIRKF